METNRNSIDWEPLDTIPGLSFRHFAGELDYQVMFDLKSATRSEVLGVDEVLTMEDIHNDEKWKPNYDIFEQLIFVELDERSIGYCGWWRDTELNGKELFFPFGTLIPGYWGRGIARLMLRYVEEKCSQIAAMMPAGIEKRYRIEKKKKAFDYVNFLIAGGYQIDRYENSMIRPIDLPLGEYPLPAGIEIRPVEPVHYRKIWVASWEAFKDHWGYTPPTEEMYQAFIIDRLFQPHLWKIAWQGEEVCGNVMNFVDFEDNETNHRKRGYTENISVRRPWRGKGLAKSLIAESIRMFKDMGMEHTWLGVDSQNTSGAYRLYEAMGYTIVEEEASYVLGKPVIQ